MFDAPEGIVYTMVMLPILLTIFFSSFLIALSGALMPGPLLTVTVSESPRRGMFTGPLMILGHGILELLLVVALLSGLAPLFLRDDIFVAISLIGGVFLLFMAFSMIRDLPNLRLDLEVKKEKGRNLVAAGVLLSAVNPYWSIWWASIGLGYIVYSAKYGYLGVGAFFTGHILADLIWYGCVSLAVVKGRNFLGERGYRRLIGGCAVFLIVFSGYFFYSGVSRLLA